MNNYRGRKRPGNTKVLFQPNKRAVSILARVGTSLVTRYEYHSHPADTLSTEQGKTSHPDTLHHMWKRAPQTSQTFQLECSWPPVVRGNVVTRSLHEVKLCRPPHVRLIVYSASLSRRDLVHSFPLLALGCGWRCASRYEPFLEVLAGKSVTRKWYWKCQYDKEEFL